MLQQDVADDFVIATGVQYSVREFIQESCSKLGLQIEWRGEGIDETATVAGVEDLGLGLAGGLLGKTIMRIDPRYFRPTEVETLLGDPTKAKEKLGWTPQITFSELVDEMVTHDLDKAKRFKLLQDHGYEVALIEE